MPEPPARRPPPAPHPAMERHEPSRAAAKPSPRRPEPSSAVRPRAAARHAATAEDEPAPHHFDAPVGPEAAPPTPVAHAAAPSAPDAAATAAAGAAWRAGLSAWLREHTIYPDAARRDGEQGRVVVRFTVDRAGQVLDVALVGSSGSASLDQAAQAMLRGARLPAFPTAMAQAQTTITVPIRYTLQQ